MGDNIDSDTESYLHDQSWTKKVNTNDTSCIGPSNKKKRKSDESILQDLSNFHSRGERHRLLLHSSKNVQYENKDVQSAFLSSVCHHWVCEITNVVSIDDQSLMSTIISPSIFYKPPPPKNSPTKSSIFNPSSPTKINIFNSDKKNSKFFDSDQNNLETYIKTAITSHKRMRRWKTHHSPMVLIMSSSTQRCLTLLQDLSTMNVRIAKLFSKHLTLTDQVNMMIDVPYAVAIGTPNRIHKLLEYSEENKSSRGLLLEDTELIILDCYLDHSKYTLFTRKDTALDLVKIMNQFILLEIKQRRKHNQTNEKKDKKTMMKIALF